MVLKVKTCDGSEVELPDDCVAHAETLANIVADCEDDDSTTPLDLPSIYATKENVDAMVEFCGLHAPKSSSDEGAHVAFFADVTAVQAVDLAMLANFLAYDALLQAATAHVGERIADKSVAEIKAMFGFTRTISEDDIAAVIQVNPWLYCDSTGSRTSGKKRWLIR